MDVFSRNKE